MHDWDNLMHLYALSHFHPTVNSVVGQIIIYANLKGTSCTLGVGLLLTIWSSVDGLRCGVLVEHSFRLKARLATKLVKVM